MMQRIENREIRKMKRKTIFNLLVILFFCGSFNVIVFAQEKKTSTSANKQEKTKKRETLKLLMDQIEVRGWIEKPQTIFVVPGVNPEVDDIILDRSFVNEILRPLDKTKFERQNVKRKKRVIPW